jgi:hypothetical protein
MRIIGTPKVSVMTLGRDVGEGVNVGGSGVAVSVGGTGVAVGGTEVAVAVGGTAVELAVGGRSVGVAVTAGATVSIGAMVADGMHPAREKARRATPAK